MQKQRYSTHAVAANMRGFTHFVLLIAVMVISVLVGVGLLVASHANSVSTAKMYKSVSISRYAQNSTYNDPNHGKQYCDYAPVRGSSEAKYKESRAAWAKQCRVIRSYLAVNVRFHAANKAYVGSCAGRSIKDNQLVSISTNTGFKCKTFASNGKWLGWYTIGLPGGKQILPQSNPQKIQADQDKMVDGSGSVRIRLGTAYLY